MKTLGFTLIGGLFALILGALPLATNGAPAEGDWVSLKPRVSVVPTNWTFDLAFLNQTKVFDLPTVATPTDELLRATKVPWDCPPGLTGICIRSLPLGAFKSTPGPQAAPRGC